METINRLEELSKETQMIRGVVIVGYGGGFLSWDVKDMETRGINYAVAYTRWYRHDDNLKKLEIETESLMRIYFRNNQCTGGMLHYETKPYKHR